MKTTIDLPDEILQRTKIEAAVRRTSIKQLVIEGLETVLKKDSQQSASLDALRRLEQGYHLGSQFLTREEANAR